MDAPDTRTLVVDDEPDMRTLIRMTIEAHNNGLVVTAEAGTGDEAVDQWRRVRPDVIVLDERMPGRSGLEAAREILAEDPTQRVVIFSACLNESVKATADELGVRACVPKDFLTLLPKVIEAVAAA